MNGWKKAGRGGKARLAGTFDTQEAAVLRGLGTGAMAPLWDRLPELVMPTTVIVGERDAKYTAIARDRLVPAIPGAELAIVPGAGHGLPREAPEAVAAAVSPPALP